MNNFEISTPSVQKEAFSEAERAKIFYLIFITCLMINLDHGIIPAASTSIEASLYLDDQQLGILGSLVYAGIVVMGFIAGPLFLKYNVKVIIQLSMAVMMISLGIFTINYHCRYAYYILRFITGVAQAPLIVYFPVWVDLYGGERKTFWLTLLQGGVPVGVFTGYVMSSVISTNWRWEWSFYFQVIVMCPALVAFFFISSKKLEIRDLVRNSILQADQEGIDYSTKSIGSLFMILLKSKVYICVTLCLCVAFYVVTGVQFWISNYFETELNQPQPLVSTAFSVISITAPTLGCIYGGSIVQYYGGYDHKNALLICFINIILGISVAAPIAFLDNFWGMCVLLWWMLFFGGSEVPPLTGISISSVPVGLRSFANSNTTIFVNLLGYLPAPSIYGCLSKHFGKRIALGCLTCHPIFAIFFISIALYVQRRDLSIKEKQKMIQSSSEQFEKAQKLEKMQGSNTTDNRTNMVYFSDIYQYLQKQKSISKLFQPDGDVHEIDQSQAEQVFVYHQVHITSTIASLIPDNYFQQGQLKQIIPQQRNEQHEGFNS